jgi:hypothetical protein
LSEPGKGTRLSAEIPLSHNSGDRIVSAIQVGASSLWVRIRSLFRFKESGTF